MAHAAEQPVMKVTEAEMSAAGVDMAYRDFCAHLLIPLNQCRRKSLYLPWKCEEERLAYEVCQYKDYKRRVAAAKEAAAAKE